MVFENFSDIMENMQADVLSGFNISSIVPIFYLILLIALYSIGIWHFYRFIAKRDCFKIPITAHPKLIEFSKYFFIYPFVAFIFFIGLALMMLFITRNYSFEALLSTAFAVVLAIRLTAYYNEDLSKDVAKMLPFALLGLFLVDPSFFSYTEIITKIETMPEFFSQCIQYILFIVLIEWVLRIILPITKKTRNIIYKNFTRKRKIKTISKI